MLMILIFTPSVLRAELNCADLAVLHLIPKGVEVYKNLRIWMDDKLFLNLFLLTL